MSLSRINDTTQLLNEYKYLLQSCFTLDEAQTCFEIAQNRMLKNLSNEAEKQKLIDDINYAISILEKLKQFNHDLVERKSIFNSGLTLLITKQIILNYNAESKVTIIPAPCNTPLHLNNKKKLTALLDIIQQLTFDINQIIKNHLHHSPLPRKEMDILATYFVNASDYLKHPTQKSCNQLFLASKNLDNTFGLSSIRMLTLFALLGGAVCFIAGVCLLTTPFAPVGIGLAAGGIAMIIGTLAAENHYVSKHSSFHISNMRYKTSQLFKAPKVQKRGRIAKPSSTVAADSKGDDDRARLLATKPT